MAKPSEVVRALLAKAGIVAYPGTLRPVEAGVFQCFIDLSPSDPDDTLVLSDIGERQFGRAMSGTTWKHYLVKAVCRSLDPQEGYDKLKAVYDFVDYREPPMETVEARGMACNVQSLYNDSGIVSLGEEQGTRRRLWGMTFGLAMQTVEQAPTEE